jgi:diguanylate cyclase (GGDEF)-like protein
MGLSVRDATAHRPVLRRLALMTVLSVIMSFVMTVVVVGVCFGFDLDRTVQVSQVFRVVLVLGTVTPAFLCPLFALRSARALRDLAQIRDRLDEQARTDQLTALLNRRGFDQKAATFLAPQMASQEACPLAVFVCDIDNFKRINDAHGHAAGDAAIRHVADLLRVTAGDAILGRQGGDEFIVLMIAAPHGEAVARAERLRAICAQEAVTVQGETIVLTISIGLATTPDFDCSLGALIKRADRALYEAKAQGRNRVAVAWDGFREAV